MHTICNAIILNFFSYNRLKGNSCFRNLDKIIASHLLTSRLCMTECKCQRRSADHDGRETLGDTGRSNFDTG